MGKLVSIAVILFALGIICQVAETKPAKASAKKPPPPPVTIDDIEACLDNIQQRLAYVSSDAKNLIDLDIDPLIDEIDRFCLLLERFFKERALGKH